jgi:hypothetical protein
MNLQRTSKQSRHHLRSDDDRDAKMARYGVIFQGQVSHHTGGLTRVSAQKLALQIVSCEQAMMRLVFLDTEKDEKLV